MMILSWRMNTYQELFWKMYQLTNDGGMYDGYYYDIYIEKILKKAVPIFNKVSESTSR